MILRLVVGVPAYRRQMHDALSDALSELRIVCMMSEAAAQMQAQKPRDRLLIPSAQPVGYHWCGRLFGDSCDLALNRNSFAAAAMDRAINADWLLMCDADTWQLDPRPTLRMIHDGHARAAAVIAAPVRKRSGVYNCGTERTAAFVREDFAGKVVPVNYIGTAWMAISIGWLREHWPLTEGDPWFEFKQTVRNGRPHHISEDFTFVRGVLAKGGAVLCDGRYEPRHDGVRYEDDQCQPASP